jgi:hypothetical protein
MPGSIILIWLIAGMFLDLFGKKCEDQVVNLLPLSIEGTER